MAMLARTKPMIRTISSIKSISTFPYHCQQLAATEPPPEGYAAGGTAAAQTPLPPNPASGSPLYNENWRRPVQSPGLALPQSLNAFQQAPMARLQLMYQTFDVGSLLNLFADWMTSQRWSDMKELFEFWVKSLDKNGKPNKPDVDLCNHYLRANLMMGATAGDLLDLVSGLRDFDIEPNTASFNLVLKAMNLARETNAAEKLLQRMEEMPGKESRPDDESYDLVISMLLQTDGMDNAFKYIDKILKGGHTLSMKVFTECVQICVSKRRLEVLESIIEKCKATEQNKALAPTWGMCYTIADAAMRSDNSNLTLSALKFMAKWIARGETAQPAVHLAVDEGLIVSALSTAGRTCNPTLVDASWAILKHSLRGKKAPNPESYLGKIYAHASLGSLEKAFATLREFEAAYGSFEKDIQEELFSPFTSLRPLVQACSKNGFESLDLVYFQLESLNKGTPPYKSIAALNCVILGCANVWDLDRAYQTFEAIGPSFGLTPDIHSYNALMFAFGRMKKTSEASEVFKHMEGLGIKPNAMSYSLIVDAHLINRDAKAAISTIDKMVAEGFVPTKEMLKKVRRRCSREMDSESNNKVTDFAKQFKIRTGTEFRREMLFNLQYNTDFA
ncbi:Pentatricopeptide repeat-containing protein At1g26460, mitochondrial [Linum grandiflorum]